LDDLFSKLKSAEVDRKLQSKHEGSTDHNLALVGGSKGKANTNPSYRQFSLSSFMSIPDEEFDVLGEEELALPKNQFRECARGALGHTSASSHVRAPLLRAGSGSVSSSRRCNASSFFLFPCVDPTEINAPHIHSSSCLTFVLASNSLSLSSHNLHR
jgi:hypothetical protein